MVRFKFRPNFGLTLIELLIAISILGILTAITVSSYLVSQQRSRDAKRKADLDTLRKALELAKADTKGAFYYTNDIFTLDNPPNPYIPSVPADPKGGSNYIYAVTPVSCTTTCTSYTLTACLENGNDPDKDTATNAGCTTPASFTVRPN